MTEKGERLTSLGRPSRSAKKYSKLQRNLPARLKRSREPTSRRGRRTLPRLGTYGTENLAWIGGRRSRTTAKNWRTNGKRKDGWTTNREPWRPTFPSGTSEG